MARHYDIDYVDRVVMDGDICDDVVECDDFLPFMVWWHDGVARAMSVLMVQTICWWKEVNGE